MSIRSQTIEKEDETKPLQRYVSKTGKTPGGGNYIIKCSLCDFEFNGSYTQMQAYLLKIKGEGVKSCGKMNLSKLTELKRLGNEVVDM